MMEEVSSGADVKSETGSKSYSLVITRVSPGPSLCMTTGEAADDGGGVERRRSGERCGAGSSAGASSRH